MAGVDVGKAAGRGIVFGEDRCGEALSAEAMRAGVMIEARGELRERKAFGGDGAEAGLECGHEEGGGDAFAGDIGHDEHEFSAGGGVAIGVEGVVIIAGNGILRARIEGDFSVGDRWRGGGDEPCLDFAGDFEVALHGDLVSEFEGEKQKKDQGGENFGFDFDAVVAELELNPRKDKQDQGDEDEDAAGGSELIHHGPEEIQGDTEGALPRGELVNFVPVEILAVEAVAGAGIGGELAPEIVDAATFADALPESAEAGLWNGTKVGR